MKKITFLLTFLLTAFVGAWGQTGPNGSVKVTDAELATGYYYIYNNGAAKYLSGSTGAYAWLDETALTDQVGLWHIQNRGAGTDGNIKYFLQAVGTSSYFGGMGPQANMNANAADNRISVRESGMYYTLSGHVDNTVGITNYNAIQFANTTGNLLNRSGGTITGSSFGVNSQWVLYKVVNATYTVSVVGTTDSNAGVQFGGNSYANGDTFSASTDITAADFTANEVEGYIASVTINGTTVVVNYLEEKYAVDFTDLYVTNTSVATTTDPIVEGKWYLLTQLRGGESPAYDRGANSVMYRAATSVTANTLLVTNTPANDIKKYLFRFFSAGVGNGYYVQTGLGNFWENGTLYGQGHKVQAVSDVSSAGIYLAYNATQSADNSTGWAFNSTADGVTYGNKLDNDAAGNTLGFWATGQTTSGGNNVWKLYPVELGALVRDINFNLEITDGTVTKTFSSVTMPEGTTISAMDFLGISTQYATSTSHTLTTADDGQTVTLTVTPTAALPVANGAYY
ncbi:MAG: hypothetical protein IJM84_01000, partial [Bacteroidaceae bacterium]|nr:hypothetical protein [Bacteroidaceae bacterium]